MKKRKTNPLHGLGRLLQATGQQTSVSKMPQAKSLPDKLKPTVKDVNVNS